MIRVRPLEPQEADWAARLYAECWGTPLIARKSGLIDLRPLARVRLKPEIPATGRDGIPIRRELELAVTL